MSVGLFAPFDLHEQFPVIKDPQPTGGFGDDEGNGLGHIGNPRRSQMAAAQAHGHFNFFAGGIEMPSGGQDYPVLPDDEGTING